jgi:5,10-methylenetetrahydrofolate reductase
MEKKIVLWISRHKPLPSQVKYLEKKLEAFEIIQYTQPIATAQKAIELAEAVNADYIVPVLPMSFVVHLVNKAKEYNYTVLRSEMELIHNCELENCPEYDEETDVILISKDLSTLEVIKRHVRFKEFVVLKDIKIITEKW